MVGGKAAALDRLIAAGVPVPATGVITIAAYRRFVSSPQVADLIDELRTTDLVPADQ